LRFKEAWGGFICTLEKYSIIVYIAILSPKNPLKRGDCMANLEDPKNIQYSLSDKFRQFSKIISTTTGNPFVFIIALLIILLWLILGPYYNYSDTWQLIINTGTSVITFLMVFVIQNSQNRDSRTMQIKLDELLKEFPTDDSNNFIEIEKLNEEELNILSQRFEQVKKWQKTNLN